MAKLNGVRENKRARPPQPEYNHGRPQNGSDRPAKKAKLMLDDSDNSDGSDSDGLNGVSLSNDPKEVLLKVNEEYARRFEHNKKREEKQQRRTCLKLGGGCSSLG